MTRFDDDLRRAASQRAREPLPANILDEALDEPAAGSRLAALAVLVGAGIVLVLAAGIGIGRFSAALPSLSSQPSPSADPTSVESSPTPGSATASTEELGVRLTLSLDRDRSSFGERVWAEATVENLGPGSVFWQHLGDCAWPVVVTVRPETPAPIDEGRADWPGDLGIFKQGLTARPILPGREQWFLPADRIASRHTGCFTVLNNEELPEGAAIEHRVGWDTIDYMGMPPVPGTYIVEAPFTFRRGAPIEFGEEGETVHVTLPLVVEGAAVEWISPHLAIDALLSDERFVGLLTDVPPDVWEHDDIAFEDGLWIVTRRIVAAPDAGLQSGTLTGVVDASSGVVLEVGFDAAAVSGEPKEVGTVDVPNSEGGSAELFIIDTSGFLVSAHGVRDAGAADEFDVQSVPGAENTIRLAWIASPCEDRPQLTVSGPSLDALELVLDRGPLPDDIECPSIGAIYAVDLVFTGDVSLDDVDAQLIDR